MTTQGTRFLTVLIFGAVFASGLLIGVAVSDPAEDGRDRSEETSGEERGERVPRPRIIDQVGLSADQEVLVDSIIEAGGARMRARQDHYEDEYRQERREILLQIREDLMTVLTPEQADQYRELLAQRDSARAEARRRQESDDGERGG
jgi:hypothetical protein